MVTKTDNLRMVKYEGKTYCISELPWDVPVISFSVTREGECCSFYWAKRWQKTLEVMEAMAGAVKQDVKYGMFYPSSGFIYGYTHLNNKKVLELIEYLGLHIEEVDRDGEPWIRWYISAEELRR